MTAYDDRNGKDAEESNNRAFLIAAGGLGLLVLLGLLCLGGYLFFFTPLARQAETTPQALATQLAATIQAGMTAQALPVTPTGTPVIVEATASPENSATATLAVALTQIDVPTHTPTGTPIPLPVTGHQDTPTPATPFTGQLEVTYPLEMTVDESDIVTVEIRLNPQLAGLGAFPALGTGVISIETSSEDSERGILEDEIALYPVMSAELVAANFDVIAGDTGSRRTVSIGHSAAWTWSIVAREPGEQKITVNIFGETTFEGEKLTVLAMSKSRNVTVGEKPLLTRFLDGLADNWAAILGTGGPLGLLLAYLTYRASQQNKELKNKVEGLEKKLDEMRKAVRRRS